MREYCYKLTHFEVTKNGEDCVQTTKIKECVVLLQLTEKNVVIDIKTENSTHLNYLLAHSDIQFLHNHEKHLRIATISTVFNLQFESIEQIFDFVEQLESFRSFSGSLAIESESRNGDFIEQSQISAFEQRTEKDSASMYFNFYAQLCQQQNMLQDSVRTYTYFQTIVQNPTDYKDKVVLDVGAGSGILSFFAAQAGAKKVYAIEASDISFFTEIQLPELVDTIISEPIGYLLLNERMLESFLHAKKFLKPEGKIFPSHSILYYAPFTDEYLYSYIGSRCAFWSTTSFYGIDLSVLKEDAHNEIYSQPIIDFVDMRSIQAAVGEYHFDFTNLHESDLSQVEIPFSFTCGNSGITHGFAFWFDIGFLGSNKEIWLSTAPNQPSTHWYQVKCLFKKPINFQMGQELVGRILMIPNKKLSYFVDIHAYIKSNPSIIAKAYIDLKNPIVLAGTTIPKPILQLAPSNQNQIITQIQNQNQFSSLDQ